MHNLKALFIFIIFSVFMFSCSEDNSDGDNGTGPNNQELGEAENGEGVFILTGDVQLNGSGTATHRYHSAMTMNNKTWAIHKVRIEGEENVYISIEFHIHDPEANMFSGKAPETGTYRVYEPGMSTPQDNYAKVTVYGDSFESYFTTDGDNQMDLTVHENGIWEAELTNVLDDYETDEVVTLHCAFKSEPQD